MDVFSRLSYSDLAVDSFLEHSHLRPRSSDWFLSRSHAVYLTPRGSRLNKWGARDALPRSIAGRLYYLLNDTDDLSQL
jgi:hypothetical protein